MIKTGRQIILAAALATSMAVSMAATPAAAQSGAQASPKAGAPTGTKAVNDPLEPFNRAMFTFNRAVVDYVVNPVVTKVGPAIPHPVQTALSNAYQNLTEIEFLLNGLLTADAKATINAAGRFAVNSTIGLGGVFDVATSMGMKRQPTDFGGALCQTGLPPGPYLVLPLIGATNAVSAPALAIGVATEVYLLSFISTTLAMADFIIIDIGGSASALRYMNELPPGERGYDIQRAEYQAYIEHDCGPRNAQKAPLAAELPAR